MLKVSKGHRVNHIEKFINFLYEELMVGLNRDVPIRIWKLWASVWKALMARIMAAANLAMTTAFSPREWASMASLLVLELVDEEMEAEGSNEFFLPGWRPQAAI